jgi:hypothetical protein
MEIKKPAKPEETAKPDTAPREDKVERKQVKEKDIKYKDFYRFTRYFGKKMTGLEAYRCMQITIGMWAEKTQNNYAIFLAQTMHSNTGMWEDFEMAIKEMIEEREEGGNERLVFHNPDFSYKLCECELERMPGAVKTTLDEQ